MMWLVLGGVHAALAAEPVWSAGVGTDRVLWLSPVAPLGSKGHTVWASARVAPEVEVGATVRVLQTPLLIDGRALEVLASAAFAPAPADSAYRPKVGIEVGWSGGVHFDWEAYFGEGWEEQDPVQRARYSPLVLGLDAAPLRFHWRHTSLSVAALSVGQLSRERLLRARLGLVDVGVLW